MAGSSHFPTPDELADLLATVIAGVAGGGKPRWRKALGPIEQLPTWSNVRCNWRLEPRGSEEERAVIEQAAALVRTEHPYIESRRERAARTPAPPMAVARRAPTSTAWGHRSATGDRGR